MKDKLRELADDWCVQADAHDEIGFGAAADVGRVCANELLAILDTEGDGGAMACNAEGTWLWLKLMDWCKARRYAPASMDDLFAIASEAHKLYTHPVRSVVVSDEDVSVVAKMIADRVGNGMREKYEELAKHMVEHFAKGERHER